MYDLNNDDPWRLWKNVKTKINLMNLLLLVLGCGFSHGQSISTRSYAPNETRTRIAAMLAASPAAEDTKCGDNTYMCIRFVKRAKRK